MQWIKHDTNANRDAKLIRVRIKYGLEGYGLYWYLLELIGAEISESNLTFELEHDAEIIAHEVGIHYQRVQEMMTYMVNLGLFENAGGTITCLKLLKRLDQSMTSNQKLRKFVSNAKKHHDPVMTASGHHHDGVMQEVEVEVEVDKNRKEVNNTPAVYTRWESPIDLFNRFYDVYPKKTGKDAALKAWKKLNPTPQLVDLLITDIQQRVEQGAWCTGKGKAFIPGPGPYLNGRKWEDEIIPRPEFKKPQDFSQLARDAQDLTEYL